MKILTLILALTILVILYNLAFEFFTNRQIVFGFMGLVAVTLLYSSLRLCFRKEDK